jgi:hypothetical protein
MDKKLDNKTKLLKKEMELKTYSECLQGGTYQCTQT